jgi:hypothetical protein
MLLIAALVVVALLIVGGAVALIVLQSDDNSEPKANTSPTSSLGAPSTDLGSTQSASPTSSAVAESAARDVVQRYLADVNAKDKKAAGALICTSHYTDWKRNADSTNGDFAYAITGATFQSSHPNTSTGGTVVTYALTFTDGASNKVAFTVIDESGPKICGTSPG